MVRTASACLVVRRLFITTVAGIGGVRASVRRVVAKLPRVIRRLGGTDHILAMAVATGIAALRLGSVVAVFLLARSLHGTEEAMLLVANSGREEERGRLSRAAVVPEL